MKGRSKMIKLFGVLVILVVCLGYLYSKGTFTLYESGINGNITPNIAKWNIKVNDKLITPKETNSIDISNIEWDMTNVTKNKVAPGSKGKFSISIDPLDTDVSIRYDISFIDSSIDSSKILTITALRDNKDKLVRTGEFTYTGVISLDEISNKSIDSINIDLEWINDRDIDVADIENSSDSDFIEIDFRAIQYNGEDIVIYTPSDEVNG